MEKRIITFKASGQSLQRVGGITTAASDTVNYFEAHFELDENWQSLDSVRAIWSNEDIAVPSLLVNDICEIPSEVLTNVSKLKVNLVGSITDNGIVTERLTTFTCPAFGITVKVPIDGTEPQEVTPTQFEQFVEAVRADANRAKQAVDDAEGQADRSETEADNALASAQNAHASELRASGYASDAQTSERNASEYAQNASESATSAEADADRAEQAASDAGYMEFHIDDNGHLIYEHTSNVDQIDFELVNGHLILEVA